MTIVQLRPCSSQRSLLLSQLQNLVARRKAVEQPRVHYGTYLVCLVGIEGRLDTGFVFLKQNREGTELFQYDLSYKRILPSLKIQSLWTQPVKILRPCTKLPLLTALQIDEQNKKLMRKVNPCDKPVHIRAYCMEPPHFNLSAFYQSIIGTFGKGNQTMIIVDTVLLVGLVSTR